MKKDKEMKKYKVFSKILLDTRIMDSLRSVFSEGKIYTIHYHLDSLGIFEDDHYIITYETEK